MTCNIEFIVSEKLDGRKKTVRFRFSRVASIRKTKVEDPIIIINKHLNVTIVF